MNKTMVKRIIAFVLLFICLAVPFAEAVSHTHHFEKTSSVYVSRSQKDSVWHTNKYEDTYTCDCGNSYKQYHTENYRHVFTEKHNVVTPHLTIYYNECSCGYRYNTREIYH